MRGSNNTRLISSNNSRLIGSNNARRMGSNNARLLDANNAKGNDLPSSPKHSIVLGLDYNRDIHSELSWFVGSTLTVESKTYAAADNLFELEGSSFPGNPE